MTHGRKSPAKFAVAPQRPSAAQARRSTPAAPPAYRPQPTPKVLQTKKAVATPAPAPQTPTASRPSAPPAYRPQPVPKVLQKKEAVVAPKAVATPPRVVNAPAAHGNAARPPVVQRRVPGVIQAKFDRPAMGRSQWRWDQAKAKLHGLPNGGSQMWADVVEAANSIDDIERLVVEKLAEREKERRDAELAKKKESAERHARHEAEQQEIAKKAREERAAREEEARLAREAREAQERREREEREARELAERLARQEAKPRRRMESLARLLESPDNVCVAVVKRGGRIYAATNKGTLAALSYESATLKVTNLEGSTGVLGERTRERDALKISQYVTEGGLSAEEVNGITQVGTTLGDGVHAEMKILNWLVGQGATGTVDIYISKLCCNNCRIAIDEWNKSRVPRLNAPGGHGNYFLGWTLPPCIKAKSKLGKKILARILGQESDTGVDDEDVRGRSRVREGPSQRERSVSPPPGSAKVAEQS